MWFLAHVIRITVSLDYKAGVASAFPQSPNDIAKEDVAKKYSLLWKCERQAKLMKLMHTLAFVARFLNVMAIDCRLQLAPQQQQQPLMQPQQQQQPQQVHSLAVRCFVYGPSC